MVVFTLAGMGGRITSIKLVLAGVMVRSILQNMEMPIAIIISIIVVKENVFSYKEEKLKVFWKEYVMYLVMKSIGILYKKLIGVAKIL
ncbi:hypothetical protein SAMN05660472_02457 [Natronincola ferrireducens]|uniref:Uncharacterized protein n=2 Tax=Natronincola ferrireducens TaxID=393762 RepID=A0A1G9GL82_9FIRM|nr:hypothetical protein SAMN05660472_02457 [Natronincola ferrireducens]